MFKVSDTAQPSTSQHSPAEGERVAASSSTGQSLKTDLQRLSWLTGKPEHLGLLTLYQQVSELAKDDKTRGEKGRYSSTSDKCCGNAGSGNNLLPKTTVAKAELGVQRRAFVCHIMKSMKLTRVTKNQASMLMGAYGDVSQFKFEKLLNYTNEKREQYFCGVFGKTMTIDIALCLLQIYIDNLMDGEDISKVVELPLPVRVGNIGNFNPVQGVAPHESPLTRGLLSSFRSLS